MAHHPADDSEVENGTAGAAALLREIEALRQRLAAVEARLPENASAAPERQQAIRQPRPQSKTGCAELEPDAAGRIARRRALGLGALASLFAFIGRSAARAADALTIEPDGVTIAAKRINFGTRLGALLTLYDPGYVVGIQASTMYQRSDKNFAWYKGGGHTDTELDPGGGSKMMSLTEGNLDVAGTVAAKNLKLAWGGLLHIGGTNTPTVTAQGAYLGWNALTGGTGETDFINNQGLGSGGFAFFNTPSSGDPRTTLMVISGAGNVTAKSFDVGDDKGVQIQGTSGRNMFSDTEKAGSLRVGAWGGIPGIYSEKGDVVVGSQSGTLSWPRELARQALQLEAWNLCAFFVGSSTVMEVDMQEKAIPPEDLITVFTTLPLIRPFHRCLGHPRRKSSGRSTLGMRLSPQQEAQSRETRSILFI